MLYSLINSSYEKGIHLMRFQYLGDNNRYKIQEPVGRGMISVVYRGWDTVLHREVAIKVLRDIYSTDSKLVQQFQRVARVMMTLRHPNIVEIYDYGAARGIYFMVMELIEGTDLRRYLRSQGTLDTERAIIIAHGVALGLGAMHQQGIVHRAVKLQNILVGRDGSIKLTGLSLVSINLDDKQDEMVGMSSAIQYSAPEQLQGEKVSPAADVYSLGAILYQMLAGRAPFDGDTPVEIAMQHIQDAPVSPRQYNPAIPPGVEEVILRCMEKVPERRYTDGMELARALEAL